MTSCIEAISNSQLRHLCWESIVSSNFNLINNDKSLCCDDEGYIYTDEPSNSRADIPVRGDHRIEDFNAMNLALLKNEGINIANGYNAEPRLIFISGVAAARIADSNVEYGSDVILRVVQGSGIIYYKEGMRKVDIQSGDVFRYTRIANQRKDILSNTSIFVALIYGMYHPATIPPYEIEHLNKVKELF